jgi:ubiquinone/menaquinone biosynthesis C-methylase UbiE
MKRPQRFTRALARQLGRPSGPGGWLVARRLNRNNREMVLAAVDACRPTPGARVADVGFGGGVGLALLLPRVSPGGRVIGVDVSKTVVDRARWVFRHEVKAGTLHVQEGSADALPLPDASVDALITVNTVYFLPDLVEPFRELARVLGLSGRAVVGLVDPAEMSRMPVTAHGFLLRPVAEVAVALGVAGFAHVEQRRGGRSPRSYHLLVGHRA